MIPYRVPLPQSLLSSSFRFLCLFNLCTLSHSSSPPPSSFSIKAVCSSFSCFVNLLFHFVFLLLFYDIRATCNIFQLSRMQQHLTSLPPIPPLSSLVNDISIVTTIIISAPITAITITNDSRFASSTRTKKGPQGQGIKGPILGHR